MEGQEQLTKSRVAKVDSEETWNLFMTQANGQGCPVFVHFTTSWCVPSLAMNSYFEELAMNYQGIHFLLVDVDEVKVTVYRCLEGGLIAVLQAYVDEDKDELFYTLSWVCDIDGTPFLVAVGAMG